ncbi:MAG TPA: hypothetical protein V6C72_19315, partial [Chroococcales cyanobacterium]
QNRTPGAYRIFWCYYPARVGEKTLPKRKTERGRERRSQDVAQKQDVQIANITIIAITPHP